MKITRYNYRAQFDDLPAVTRKISRALADGDYILTESVAQFEQRFATYIGTDFAIGVNSGTDALMLALTALGIGPGDEVITVANTFHATVLAIVAVGATPILVDCEPDTHLMDLNAAEAACGPRTRAILAVHLFGRSLDMDRLTPIAADHGVEIIEDCAQAVGATWRGRKVGTFGTAAAFSFHPSKNLAAAGDAGAITTNDAAIAHTVQILRGLGQDGQNNHVRQGVNSKLDAIQAIVLDAKLDRIDQWNNDRRRIARLYRETLASMGIHITAHPSPPGDHVYHLLQVAVPGRDTVLAQLQREGIDAVARYPIPIHHQPAFTSQRFGTGFPHAEYQAANTLCLPIRPDLTDIEVDHVCRSLHTTATEDISA